MRTGFIPPTLAFVIFLIFIFSYDIALAADESKAYLTMICGALFFSASIVSNSNRTIAKSSSEAVATLATMMVVAIVFFSLPITIPSILPRKTASRTTTAQGALIGPNIIIMVDAVNLELTFEKWNGSGYNITTRLTSQGLTKKAAIRVLSKCSVNIDDYRGDLRINLTGARRLHERVTLQQVIQIPRSMRPSIIVTAANGSLNITGLRCEEVDAQIGSGIIEGYSLETRTCRMLVENGPIDMEVNSSEINLETINGDISLVSIRPEAECTLESVNGRIDTHLNFSERIGYRIEANSLGGDISVNFTGITFTKKRSGFILARTKDYENKELTTKILARTTTGNVTISMI